MYKENCMFRKRANICGFKMEDCNSEKCDFYDLEFKSKAIKERLELVKQRQADLIKQIKDKKTAKKIFELEQKDPNDKMVVEYKIKLLQIKDLEYGMKYLKKSLLWSKRLGK